MEREMNEDRAAYMCSSVTVKPTFKVTVYCQNVLAEMYVIFKML